MTIPNIITTIRIILAPIFVIYLIDDRYLSALTILVLCGVSDGLDGLIARLFNQKSKLGAYLDPLADKIILITAFIALAIQGLLPAWLTVTVIARDLIIVLGIFLIVLNRVELRMKPSFLSKMNTCFQFIALIMVLSKDVFSFSSQLLLYFFYLTALFTIASGLHYMYYWFKSAGVDTGE